MKRTVVKLTLLAAFEPERLALLDVESLGDAAADLLRDNGALTATSEYDTAETDVPEDADDTDTLIDALDRQFPSAQRPAVEADPDANWRNDAIQFPRLLAELMAVLRPDDYGEVAAAMDLSTAQVHELFDRAQTTWDHIKGRT